MNNLKRKYIPLSETNATNETNETDVSSVSNVAEKKILNKRINQSL